jgi:hypothetical protein
MTRKGCGQECSCPSKLAHEIDGLIRRQEAPIPPMSMPDLLRAMRAAVEESDDE